MAPLRARMVLEQAQKNGWKKGVELGVLRGDTFRFLSKFLDMTGVDLWTPQIGMDAIEGGVSYKEHDLEGYYAALSLDYGDRLLRMDTAEAAKLFPDDHFDFVFIDADHTYEGVKRDIEAWRPKVKNFMGHDYDHPDFPGVKRAVDEFFRVRRLKDRVWLAEHP